MSDYFSAEEYYADIGRLSNSMISTFIESSLLFEHQYVKRTYKREATPEMTFGSALHCYMLQTSEYHRRYKVAPKCDRRTKEGKAIYADFELTLGDAEILTQEQADTIHACVGALLANEYIHQAFESDVCRVNESPIKFEYGGMPCKALPDMVLPDAAIIFDLKTTRDPSPSAFRKTVVERGYHRQAWFYREALRRSQDLDCEFVFICVRSVFPFETATYTLDAEMYRLAEIEVNAAIAGIQERYVRGNWVPNWSIGTLSLAPPKWFVPFNQSFGGE